MKVVICTLLDTVLDRIFFILLLFIVSCHAVYYSTKIETITLIHSVLIQVVNTVSSTIIKLDVGVVVIGVVDDYYFVCTYTYTKRFE